MQSRPGAVLIFTLLLLVVLDCVLVGMLEVARQQRRIAENRAQLLKLQLAAEGAVRRSLAEWWPTADDDTAGDVAVGGLLVRHAFERLSEDLVLVSGTASEQGARYVASLLARPPAIPPDSLVAAAALVAYGATLHPGSTVSAGPPSGCDRGPGFATSTVTPPAWSAGALIDGPITHSDQSLPDFLRRLADDPRGGAVLRVVGGDTALADAFDGILVAAGTVTLTDGAGFRGLLIAGGDLVIAAGATVTGSARAGGRADVHGLVQRDACAVETALRAAGLRTATAVSGRAWIPAF